MSVDTTKNLSAIYLRELNTGEIDYSICETPTMASLVNAALRANWTLEELLYNLSLAVDSFADIAPSGVVYVLDFLADEDASHESH